MTEYFDRLAENWDQNPMKVARARATAEQCRAVDSLDRSSLLDIGGGTGLLSFFLQQDFDSITIADTSSEMLRVAREKIDAAAINNIRTSQVQTGIAELEGTFSAAIVLMTLHHIRDLDAFFGDIRGLLTHGGTLMIADLHADPDGSFHCKSMDFDGHDGFEIEQLRLKAVGYGFQPLKTETYFEIRKPNRAGVEQSFPLFFMALRKEGS